ncbi:MAG TPA: PIN domain-containing protein [Pyrinomonadaceae bacterium]|nr:PIN domain-containing protein [Pyrinomonadaceae bacterium]
MSSIVSDTHALIWFLANSPRLSRTAGLAFEETQTAGDLIYVPSIVIVELRYLVEKRTFSEADYQTILAAVTNPATALTIAPLDLAVANALAQIPRKVVSDMPDRIIAATALSLSLPLVTRDAELRQLTNITTVW